MVHILPGEGVGTARIPCLTIARPPTRAQLRAMSTATFHRLLALLGYVSCLAATPAIAQMGPIQPVLVTDGKVEYSHNRPDIEDASVPLEVHVAKDGTVTNVVVSETSGNL